MPRHAEAILVQRRFALCRATIAAR